MSDLVTLENGPRPSGKPDECFYCGMPLGLPHRDECVCLSKTVMVEYTLTLPRDVVRSWDKDMVEFHLNESSWCANNLIRDLTEMFPDDGDADLCPSFSARVVDMTPSPEVAA